VDADGAADVVELLGEERGRYRVVEAGARAEHDGEDDEREDRRRDGDDEQGRRLRWRRRRPE